ncbi:hypothetical protein DSM106972_038650 [Dulcicalothrix desertica PCC 7102]|uniref:HXXEE domain-containing protein n=1 Tax=Dulcicalothrix desertica PCC 7102 TaxID=232991 RepID=A0A3S1D7M6_9CYAN|nr:HXXEE domain-containing protein [Dulcicalothrix desertica]RUT05044.1 hypothetical protein DSM106972_038650 [Dulcicalothrix desertica PCC 7102]TWH62585.1 uncharacterized protein with HXXEE motif [Dulcicalothrix desertica PCC 7102]
MINSQHFLFDISISVLAIAIIVHTVDEAWFGAEQKALSDWRTFIFNRALFLDNLPIFISVIGAALAGWQWGIVGGILPAIGVTHTLLDHLGLSWKTQKLRPGSWTGLLLLLPLSLGFYALSYTDRILTFHELLISSAIGLAISIWLLWMTKQELVKHP